MSADDLREREQAGGNTPASASEQTESDRVGKGYTPSINDKGGKLRKRSLKRWGTGIILSLVLGGGGIGVFNIASGPGEFIHYGKVLSGFHMSDDSDLMDNQLGQLWRYMRTADAPERRNLSYWGNKFADHFEAKLKDSGITPGYQSGRIKTLTIDTKTDAGKRAIQNLKQQGIAADALQPNNKGVVVVDIDKPGVGSARFRRTAIRGMVGATDMGGLGSAMASRWLIPRAEVDFHPLKNIARAADEDIKDYIKKRKEERAARIQNGADASATTVSVDENGDANDPNAGADNSTAEGAAEEANDILGDAADPNASVGERSAKIRGRLTAGVGATGFLATVCGAKALGDAAGDLQNTNVNLPLIRTGMDVLTVGAQVIAGIDVNPDELGALHESLYDEKTKTSWIDAKSIQAEFGQEQTGPDMPNAAKPGSSSKPAFFTTLDSTLGAIPGANGFCGGVNTAIGGWVLSAAGIVSAATGPVSLILGAATEAVQYLLSDAFMDDLVRWLAGEQVDKDPAGALWGNYANYGVRLAANDISISHGGRELSSTEEAALAMERRQIDQEVNSQRSFYARYFDLHNTNSIAARLLYQTPALSSPDAAKTAVARLPGTMFSTIIRPFTNLLSSKVKAAAPAYNYGFPAIGFPLDEIDNEGNKNPYERAKILEPKLAQLNDAYGSCFNMTIDPVSFRLVSQEAKRYDEIDAKCNDTRNTELTQYRFYIATMTAAKIAACYANIDEESCQELGFGTALAGESSGLIDMANIYEDSSEIDCAANTRKVGVQDGYHEGNLVRITLCAIPNIPCQSQECIALGGKETIVNSRVSGAYYALGEAARLGGVQLYANSTFRTMANQEALCNDDPGCKTGSSYADVAKPGTSNHQMGLAVDFSDDKNGAIVRDDIWFDWLAGHAGTYGIKNYPREAWHWSPTGS